MTAENRDSMIKYRMYHQYKRIARFVCLMLAAMILQVAPAWSQSYTLAPAVFPSPLDGSGNIVVGGCIWTYAAGTTSAISTYSNNAGALNSNPIIVDINGRYVAYLLAGTNYKFVFETACTPPAHGGALSTQDNISGLPASAATVDVSGTVGETIAAGNCAYLSDGSGSKNAGQWYKCDVANFYSSALPELGMVPNAITSGNTGTIRLAGTLSGLSALSVGAEYFVGAAGAITSTMPALARHLGHADSATTFVLTSNPAPPLDSDNAVDDFRLTLTTAVPVTSADVTAATTIYATPYRGNRISLTDSSGRSTVFNSIEFSIAVPATTNTMYDVFAYSNAGTPTLELLAWTNDTTRATALVMTTTGFYTKSGDLTRRYLGSVRTTAVSGQTEDSGFGCTTAKRYLWNYYNRVRRPLCRYEATSSWTYTLSATRQANGAAANQVEAVIGIAETTLDLQLTVAAANSAGANVTVGIGEDSTTTYVVGSILFALSGGPTPISGRLVKTPAVGKHVYSWNEWSTAAGTTTWHANTGSVGGTITAGLAGWIEG